MKFVLHAPTFDRIPLTGRLVRRQLEARSREIANMTAGMSDPNVSIVIRSRNNSSYVKQWFEDIRAQDFNGKIEIIVVDTESTDDTVTYARSQGAKIISLTQEEFTYPRALNAGFRAAKYPYVVTLVGHSNLSNRMMLRSLTYWSQHENFAGVYSLPVVNTNGSIWDRLSCVPIPLILRKPKVLGGPAGGMLGANASAVKREAWERLGGYDESYAGGGEDTALARSMLAANLMVVREPLWTLFHSHGLGFMNAIKQIVHWIEVGKDTPQAFVTDKIHSRRPDLRA